ncbi:ABC transporter substrate-binding protein [Pseudodesulfovibrio sp.]|uniref:ABC transporter substrate-binding protein n=1 Tax=Pseudodesulfovibrio sp. TaxID=2035812 RepID=UPI002608131A|nr:ABC transporter substrate-binding protein [Pseudodesulfovibrio sp.]MDD3311571.1 ABC transporter substrate-binding protein [Pseudodesulfovibrio sp.]
MSRFTHLLPAALLALLLTAAPAGAIEKASIVLQWLPQAQFAGYYVAKDKGFYEEEGIYLHIMSGGPDVLASEYLETGRADFATLFLATGIQRRATLPLVNIGQFVQNSALMLICKKSSGIEKVEDLAGKKVGLWANEFQIQARALFKKRNMRVTVVPQSDSLDMFMRGGVQAASGMWYNEYHTLMTYGLKPEDLTTFFYTDYDLNFPEDGIYCLEKTANRRPELCRALVRATARGWMYAFNHPEEALDSVMKRMKEARVPASRAHQRWMLARMEDIILSDQVPSIGVLRQADYERVVKILEDVGVIDKAPLFPEFYRGPVR